MARSDSITRSGTFVSLFRLAQRRCFRAQADMHLQKFLNQVKTNGHIRCELQVRTRYKKRTKWCVSFSVTVLFVVVNTSGSEAKVAMAISPNWESCP